jgi:hypothetical protein
MSNFYLPDSYYDPPSPDADGEELRLCPSCTAAEEEKAARQDIDASGVEVKHLLYWERWGRQVTYYCDVTDESFDVEDDCEG